VSEAAMAVRLRDLLPRLAGTRWTRPLRRKNRRRCPGRPSGAPNARRTWVIGCGPLWSRSPASANL